MNLNKLKSLYILKFYFKLQIVIVIKIITISWGKSVANRKHLEKKTNFTHLVILFFIFAPMTCVFGAFSLSFPYPSASVSASRNCATSFVSQTAKKYQIRQSFSLPPANCLNPLSPSVYWLPLENRTTMFPCFLRSFFSPFCYENLLDWKWKLLRGRGRGLEITSSNPDLIIGIRTFVTPSIETEFKVSELPTDLFLHFSVFYFFEFLWFRGIFIWTILSMNKALGSPHYVIVCEFVKSKTEECLWLWSPPVALICVGCSWALTVTEVNRCKEEMLELLVNFIVETY